jgi:hypothetical protein
MNYRCKYAGSLLAVLLSVCLPGAMAHASSVTVVVCSVEGATGAKVEVPINIRNAQQLGAMQMEMTYDPAVLEAKTVEKGGLPQEITVGSNVIAPGRLRIVMNASARESISGDGTLMKAVFEVKGTRGQRCDLHLTGLRAWDNTKPEAPPYEMLATVEPGTFTVVGGLPVIPLMLGAAVVLILLIVLAVARKGRGAHNTG